MSLESRLLAFVQAVGGDIKALLGRALPAGGAVGQVMTKTGAGDYVATWADSTSPPLSHAEASLSADVSLSSSNTWYNGPAVTLEPGTWLINAHVTHVRSATTAETVYARLTDGTNHHASQQMYHASVSGTGVALHLSAVVTLPASTTLRVQCATSAGAAASAMKAAMTSNGAGNNATQITAVRIA